MPIKIQMNDNGPVNQQQWGRSVDNAIKLLYGGGLVLLPLVYWPWALIPYEIPKVQFLYAWVGLLYITGLVRVVVARKLPNKHKRGVWWAVLFVGVGVFSSVRGVDLYQSVVGNYYRWDGLVTLVLLFGLMVFTGLFVTRSWDRWVSGAIAIGALAVSGWALLQAIVWGSLEPMNLSNWGGAQGAGFGQPVFLAGYLVVTLPVAFLWLKGKRLRRWLWLGLTLVLLAIVATRSWGGMVGLATWGLLTAWPRLSGRRRWVLLVVTGAVVVGALIGGTVNWQEPEGRGRIWARSYKAWQERPWLGWGVANVDRAVESVQWPEPRLHDVYVDKAHASLVETAVTTGLIGLVAWLGMIGTSGAYLWRKGRRSEGKEKEWYAMWLTVLVLYLVMAQLNVTSVATEVMLWIALGVAYTTARG